MSEASERPSRPAIRLRAREGGAPLGAVFGGIGLGVGLVVALLHLDRLPLVLCAFKGLTGLPCPTCGSTRALARLARLDLGGALSMNPLLVAGAGVLAAWALADLALLPQRRALAVELGPRLAFGLRLAALGLVLANWVYLLAAGR